MPLIIGTTVVQISGVIGMTGIRDCNHGNVEKIMIYFAFIVVSVSSFIVFDCYNVKLFIMKVNVMRQKHSKHQHIQSDRDSFLYDKFHGAFVYRNGLNYQNGLLKLT